MTEFEINGQTVIVEDVDPHCTLLDWLRASGRTGAKEGCAEGECGACAVVFLSRDASGNPRAETVNSCLVSLADVAGRRVVSVEGVSGPLELHPIQQALVSSGGSQCGYCTPGFVMSLFSEYYRPGRAVCSRESVSGNLCRCTGYRPILSAAESLGAPAAGDPWLERLQGAPERLPSVELAERPAVCSRREAQFARPGSLGELLEILALHPDAVLVAGGTDLMVDVNQRGARHPLWVSIAAVSELCKVEWRADEVVLGAGISLSELERELEEPRRAAELAGLLELLPLFSSRLIRNRATIGGNLATASPIGDLAPVLLALGADLTLASDRGRRRVPLSSFFLDYRKTALAPSEIIASVHLQLPLPRIQRFYKLSKRPLDDISTVAAAFALDLTDDGRVERLRVAYGGIAATPLCANAVELAAVGQPWDDTTLAALLPVLDALGTPLSDHRGSASYRRSMMRRLLERFCAETFAAPPLARAHAAGAGDAP